MVEGVGSSYHRPEDAAYSFVGILDLHLPVLHGESANKVLGRLLAEIILQSGDVSILDWVRYRAHGGICKHSFAKHMDTSFCVVPCTAANCVWGRLLPTENALESRNETLRQIRVEAALRVVDTAPFWTATVNRRSSA